MSPAGDTATRLRRLLAILTWLAQEGEAPIDEVAARFDLTPTALVAELEMAACCGVPPYTPGPAARDRGHRGHGVDPGRDDPRPAPSAQPARGPGAGRVGPRPAGRPGERRGRRPVPGPGQARPGPRADRQSRSSSTRPTCSTSVRTALDGGRAADHHLLLGVHRPDGRADHHARGACSRPRATGTWTPGARWPTASAGSGSTGSPRRARPGRRRPRCWPTSCPEPSDGGRRDRRPVGGARGLRPRTRQPAGADRRRPVHGVAVRVRPRRPSRSARRAAGRCGRSSSAATPGSSGCCSGSAPTPRCSSPSRTGRWPPRRPRRILARYRG